MAVFHAKQDARGAAFVGTSTLTIFNSQGSTTTQAASDVVTPADWNSGHANLVTISSQTAGASSAATATNVVLGGGGGFAIAMSTAAGKATQHISRVEPVVYMSEYEPISGSKLVSDSSLVQNSLYFVPFYVKKLVYVSRVNFFVSVSTAVSAGNNTGSGGVTLSAAMYSRMTAAGSNERISQMWSCTYALSGTKNSHTQVVYTNVTGIANSQSVATVVTSITATNATTYPANSVAGYRVWAMPMNSSLTPGRYWMAVAQSTAAANAGRFNIRASIAQQNIDAVANIAYQRVGTSSSASNANAPIGAWLGGGTYSATSGGFPASVPLTSDSIRAGLSLTLPYFNFSGHDTTNSIL